MGVGVGVGCCFTQPDSSTAVKITIISVKVTARFRAANSFDFSEALFFLLLQTCRLYYFILSVAEQEIKQKIRRDSIKSRQI